MEQNLKGIMWSERSQSHEVVWLHLYGILENTKTENSSAREESSAFQGL